MILTREFYIPKNSTKVADKLSDAVAYIYTTKANRLAAAMFFGKQAKPVWHYNFRSETEREKTIRETFANRRSALAAKAQWRAEAAEKSAAARKTVQVGDIYRTCWGYDQTNVEFFQVVEVRGAYAILREIAAASDDNGHGSERCVPQSDNFLAPRYEGDDQGQPIRRLIQDGRIKIDDVRTAWPWGKRVAGIVVGEACSRTASGWGH